MRWDLEAKYTLLIKILEQNPSFLSASNVDIEKIRSTWPKDEVPTARMIPYQLSEIRKELKTIGNQQGTPKNNPVITNGVGSGTPRIKSAPSTIKTPTKRPASANTAKRTPPSAKKLKSGNRKKLGKNHTNESSDSVTLTSSEEDADTQESDAEDNDEEELTANVGISRTRRVLPARLKSRSRTYVEESDSTKADDGARTEENDSQEDPDFDLLEELQGKMTSGKKRNRISRKLFPRRHISDCLETDLCGEPSGGDLNSELTEQDNVCKGSETGEEGKSTTSRRTSWQSALEEH